MLFETRRQKNKTKKDPCLQFEDNIFKCMQINPEKHCMEYISDLMECCRNNKGKSRYCVRFMKSYPEDQYHYASVFLVLMTCDLSLCQYYPPYMPVPPIRPNEPPVPAQPVFPNMDAYLAQIDRELMLQETAPKPKPKLDFMRRYEVVRERPLNPNLPADIRDYFSRSQKNDEVLASAIQSAEQEKFDKLYEKNGQFAYGIGNTNTTTTKVPKPDNF